MKLFDQFRDIFIRLEYKYLRTSKTMGFSRFLAIAFFLLAMAAVHNGVRDYHQHREAVEAEALARGSDGGVRLFYVRPAASVFFHKSGLFDQLRAEKTGEEAPAVSHYSLPDSPIPSLPGLPLPFDLGGLFFLLGGTLVMAYGYRSPGSVEYLRMLASLRKDKDLGYQIYFARYRLVISYSAVVYGCGILLANAEGVTFSISDYVGISHFIIFLMAYVTFLYQLGMSAGCAGSRPRLIRNWVIWVLLVPLIPTVATAFVTSTVKGGPPNHPGTNAEPYALAAQTRQLSLIVPVTSYIQNSYAGTGGRDYRNALEFHRAAGELMAGKKTKGQQVRQVRDSNSYLYYGRCRIPRYWWIALLFSTFWLLSILGRRKRDFENMLLRRDDGEPLTQGILERNRETGIQQGKNHTVNTGGQTVKGQGRIKEEPGKYRVLRVMDQDLKDDVYRDFHERELDFLYLCRPQDIPKHLTIKDLLSLAAYLLEIPPDRVNQILAPEDRLGQSDAKAPISTFIYPGSLHALLLVLDLARAAGKTHYLFYDLMANMDGYMAIPLKKRMETLCSEDNAAVLFLTRHPLEPGRQLDTEKGFWEETTWASQVDQIETLEDPEVEEPVRYWSSSIGVSKTFDTSKRKKRRWWKPWKK